MYLNAIEGGQSSTIPDEQSVVRDVVSVRLQTLAALASGAAPSSVSRGFSRAMSAAAQEWAEAWMSKHPPPRELCVVELGSTARDEALPGLRSSSDIDYMIIVTEGACTEDVTAWARGLHEELERRGASQGVEFCHRLNGIEYRRSPEGLFAQATSPFDAGNLCTARFLAGDRATFEALREQVALFHAESDGDPAAEVAFLRPKKAQLRARMGSWSGRALADTRRLMKDLERATPEHEARVYKDALQIGVVAVQILAVLHALEARNTIDRIAQARERGFIEAQLATRVADAIDHFARQKARAKQDLPCDSAMGARPHLESLAALLEQLAGATSAHAPDRDAFERRGTRPALALAAPESGPKSPGLRPHDVRAHIAREGTLRQTARLQIAPGRLF